MLPTYKCLIDKTVKELPSLEALADRYPYTDKETLKSYLDNAKEILEVAQTRAGALLYWLHCSELDKGLKQVEQSQDFKLIFSVNGLGSVSEFSRIFTTESKNLAKEEGLRIERMFSDATKAITWTFIKIEDQQGNEVW